MKKYGNLYEQIISIENLKLADEIARKGKRNSYGVKLHDKNREQNILNLHEQLKNHTYKTSKYSVFKIYEPKEREIYRLPYYPDRIVHHAIMNILEPIWQKHFTYNIYACIKKRGIHKCMFKCRQFIDSYPKDQKVYCLKIDIKKFYPSVKADVMKSTIRKKIKCKETLALLDEIIDSAQGLPIGNYISQYMANLLTTQIMRELNKIRAIKAVSYADDIVVFSNDKEILHDVLDNVLRPVIEDKLQLEIKSNYQIFPIATSRYSHDGRGLDYVGYVLFREHTALRKNIKKNFAKKAKKIKQKGIKNYKKELAPFKGWSDHANAKHLIKIIYKSLNNES